MINVPVTSRTMYWRSYDAASVPDLEALKKAIAQAGRTLVHLVTADPWEGDWDYFQANIPLEELSDEHLSWLWEPSGRRHLVCGL